MATAPRKIFAGPRLKRLRRERQLTQAGMAAELDVSPSYLNLMERNQRPITVQVLIRLTDVYGIDPRDFIESEGEHSAGEMEQILADPLFREAAVPRAEVRDAAENSPALLAAMARLYRAYAAAREASEAGVAAGTDRDRAEPVPGESPVERIRTFMHEARNHFPELEDAAETFAAELALGKRPSLRLVRTSSCPPWHPRQGAAGRGHGRPVALVRSSRRQLMISEVVEPPGRTFQAAYQLALSQFGELLSAIAARLEPTDGLSRQLLRITLANYFAGAVMMPYGRFYEAAELASYDVEILAARFEASFEQVAHRLTRLGRQTARGVPFFLVRVDMAGNFSKRFSSSRFPFANSGGTCALWNIHAAFAEPGRILTQVIELTDGSQWFSIARTVRRSLTPWGAIEPRFAIGLGCEIKYARRLVYAKRLDFNALDATHIGINCRLCDRPGLPAARGAPSIAAAARRRVDTQHLAVHVQGCVSFMGWPAPSKGVTRESLAQIWDQFAAEFSAKKAVMNQITNFARAWLDFRTSFTDYDACLTKQGRGASG